MQKVKYNLPNEFVLDCSGYGCIPQIRWYDDGDEACGFIYFKMKDEFRVFYSKDKKLLDAMWNSVGLVRRALKLVEDVQNG